MAVSGLLKLGGLVAGAYLLDVTLREALAARRARKIADRLGKPLLNVGSGVWGSSATGPKLRGDINCDLAAAKDSPCGPDAVCRCDAADLSRFRTGQFGATLAANVLRYVPDRAKAMKELKRVTVSAGSLVVTDNWLPWPQWGPGPAFPVHKGLSGLF